MELAEEERFLGLFAQVQALDAVMNAIVITHPAPTQLLQEIQEQIALVHTTSAAGSSANPLRGAFHEKLQQECRVWLQFAKTQLR